MKILTINRETNSAIISTNRIWLTLLLAMGILFLAGYGTGAIFAKLFL